jgi:hypothetical protein
MDSSNLSRYPEPRADLGADKELLLLIVLLCNSEASQEATHAVEPKTNLSFDQNNHLRVGLVDTSPVTGVPL